MFLEIPRLVLRDQIVQCPCEEGKISVVVVRDGVGQGLVLQRQEMLEVDVEGGEVVDPETVNLGNVVFIARRRA